MADGRTMIRTGNDPFLTVEELQLLGAVVAYGAMVEAVAAGMHGALTTSSDDPNFDSAHTTGLQITPLLKDLRSFADNDAAQWAADAEPAIGRRHALVHTAWMIRADFGSGSSEAIVGSRTHRSELMTAISTPDDLITSRDDLRALWQRGRDINARLHGLEP